MKVFPCFVVHISASLLIGTVLAVSGCSSGSSSGGSSSPPPSDPPPSDPPPSDPPPAAFMSELVVYEPLDNRVAAPDIPVRAECLGAPAGHCSISVSVASYDEEHHDDDLWEIASSMGGKIDMVIDLLPFVSSSEGTVVIEATDSTGARQSVRRYVYLERSPALSRETTIDGMIVDADRERILYMQKPGADERLFFVRSRDDDTVLRLNVPDDLRRAGERYGWVTSQGALLLLSEPQSSTAKVIDAREEGYDELANVEALDTVVVSGDYAIWRVGNELWRWQFSNRQASLVSDVACPTSADVMSDGRVAYCARYGGGDDVYVFTTERKQRITDDGHQKEDIRSDGSRFVYKRISEEPVHGDTIVDLIVHDGVSERILLHDVWPDPEWLAYEINEGWIAYLMSEGRPRFNADLRLSLWLTHAVGDAVELGERRIFRTIESVGSDGSVIASGIGWRLLSPILGELRFSSHDTLLAEFEYAHERVMPGVRELDGNWIVFIGDSLFRLQP